MDKCECVKLKATLSTENSLRGVLKKENKINASLEKDNSGGTIDYRQLNYLPTINGEKVIDDKTSKDYHIQGEMQEISNLELEKLLV